MEKVKIEKYLEGEGGYRIGRKHWDVNTLWKASEGLPVFKIPLAAIDLELKPWAIPDFLSILYHVERINKVGFEYPVIMNPDGHIIDGWHRIAKAILKGRKYINAVRFNVMPEPDEVLPE